MKAFFSLLVAVCLFFSCSILKNDNSPKFEEPSVKLEGTEWILIGLNSKAVEIDVIKPIKIKISNDNSFKGFAGCNQFWGVCKLMQSQIAFSNINRTKMRCEKIDIENELTETLRNTHAYLINGNKLQLINKNAEIIAVFQSNNKSEK